MSPDDHIHPSLLQRKIIHVDMDAFYAAVEMRDDPNLRGKPVVIGGKPDSRAVVCTASYEARKFGIRSAMPCSQAARLCADAIFLKPNFEKYKTASLGIRAIFGKYTDKIEPLSLDEAFLDVTGHELFAVKIGSLIQKEIAEQLQLSCSVGVAPNKLLAKIASDFRKPFGLTVVIPDQAKNFMRDLPLRKIHGVGPATEKRLKLCGFEFCHDLWPLSLEETKAKIGENMGNWLYMRAQGVDDRPVENSRERKSIGAETTFAVDLLDMEKLLEHLKKLCERVSAYLIQRSLSGRTITVKVKYHDFTRITRSHSLLTEVSSAAELYAEAHQLLTQRTDIGKKKIRLVGVSIANFK